MVERPVSRTLTFNETRRIDPTDRLYCYEFCRYRGWASWPPMGPATNQPAYLCMEKPDLYRASADSEQAYYLRRIADGLWLAAEDAARPPCVVPECPEKAREVFVAAESGRLAGRSWARGDKIQVCPRHSHDIRRAQGARGMDQLAEWLRPEAMWDPMDAYDGGADLLYGAEILERDRADAAAGNPEVVGPGGTPA